MNEIIAGYKEGCTISILPHSRIACVSTDLYFTKVHVSDMQLVNSTTAVDTTSIVKGLTQFGAMGALAGAQAQTEILVQIFWKNGEKSIAKVSKDMFEVMLIGMNTDYTPDSLKTTISDARKAAEYQKQKDEEMTPGKIIFIVLLCGWIVLVLLANANLL